MNIIYNIVIEKEKNIKVSLKNCSMTEFFLIVVYEYHL